MPDRRSARTVTAWRPSAPAARRLLAALVAMLQLVLAFSPLLESDAGELARVHVEEQGIQLHWSHDSAECAGCAYRLIGAAAPSSPAPQVTAPASLPPEPAALAVAATDPDLSSRHSRAPPSVT